MKKIAIDISTVNSNMAGIGHYAYGIAKGLISLNDGNDYILFTNDKSKLKNINLPLEKVREIKHNTGGFGWMWKVSRILKNENFDWLVSPAYLTFGILFPKTIQFVQDLAPIYFPKFFPFKDRIRYRLLLEISLRKSKIVATTSESVRSELLEKFKFLKPEDIVACGAGLHSWVFEKKDIEKENEIRINYKLPEKFLLSVSTLEPRKNYENVIRAIKLLKDEGIEINYVIAGKKGWYYEQIINLVKVLDLQRQIYFLGYFPEERLPYLLDASSGLVYTSFYEGFGLPAIEAAARDLHILTSNIPVMRESMREFALYTDPKNVNEIANGLKSLWKPSELSRKTGFQFTKTHTWQNTAYKISSRF